MTDLTWQNVTVRLGDLKPWADNPRTSTKAQAKRILASFERFGQVVPIAVSPDNEVYDGHQRLSALLTIHGASYEIEARRASRALKDDERRTLVLALANATGSWNWDVVPNWGSDLLKEWGFDKDTLSGWKQDVTALGEFLKSEAPAVDAPAETDRAAELLEKWQVKSGDLFEIGPHRLICGDCTDAAMVARVMDGEKAAAVITDPPYNVAMDGRADPYSMDVINASEYKDWDEGFDPSKFLEGLVDIVDGNIFVFCNQYLAWTSYLPFLFPKYDVASIFVWSKPFAVQNVRGVGFAKSYELAVYAWNKGHYFEALSGTDNYDVWHGTSNEGGKSSDHPTAKPLALINRIVTQLSPKDGIVYEPFSGSGTTLVACENLGRKCRAIEISPAYVAVALERMSTAFPALPIRRLE